jgi:hypothetical protein
MDAPVINLAIFLNGGTGLRPAGFPVAWIMWQAGVDPHIVETVARAAMADDTRPRWERAPS